MILMRNREGISACGASGPGRAGGPAAAWYCVFWYILYILEIIEYMCALCSVDCWYIVCIIWYIFLVAVYIVYVNLSEVIA